MQEKTDSIIVEWLDSQPAENIWITIITYFETCYGIFLLEDGKRKTLLREKFEQVIKIDLEYRITLFDTNAANISAQLSAKRRAEGKTVDMRDTFIAGIAVSHTATLVTRNIRHFDDLPIPVINPWNDK